MKHDCSGGFGRIFTKLGRKLYILALLRPLNFGRPRSKVKVIYASRKAQFLLSNTIAVAIVVITWCNSAKSCAFTQSHDH